ncbi:GNAT family N-acetyltransferase [Marinomonas epiphytica]
MDMHVRPAILADLDSLVRLDQDSNPYPWGAGLVNEALQSRSNWVIEDTSRQILAWLCSSPVICEQSELELVLVATQARRQGLARCVINVWLSSLSQQGAKECLLEVRESNIGAIELYRKLGFNQVGVRKGYYPSDNGREAAHLYTLVLQAH